MLNTGGFERARLTLDNTANKLYIEVRTDNTFNTTRAVSLDNIGNFAVNSTAQINSILQSTSTNTGALVVSGGVGIGGGMYVGGNAIFTGKIYGLTITFPSQASGVATAGGLGLVQPTTSTQAVTVHQVSASTANGAFITAIVAIKYGVGTANTGTITTIASSNMSLSWYAATANYIMATQTTGVASTLTMSSLQLN